MAEETKIGLPKNTVAAICYIPFIGWIAAIVFFLIEKDKLIRFHAMQSIVLEIGGWILKLLMGLTLILIPLVPLVMILIILLQLYLILQTYNGKEISLPKIGDFVKKQLGKTE